jgi:hypothetical protein
VQTFAKAWEFFKNDKMIPVDLLTKFDTFTISEKDYYDNIAIREDRMRHVYWEAGKVKFNTFTQPPHGTTTGVIQGLIEVQLPGDRIFVACNDCIYLWSLCWISSVAAAFGTRNKEPDAAWKIRPGRIPGYNPALHAGSFPIDPNTGLESPIIVVEVACSNESIPILTTADLNAYFGPGTGTRVWLGLKVFKKSKPHLPHCWWFGMAVRDQINGVFQNSGTMSANSLPIVTTNNRLLSLPVHNTILRIDVNLLFQPFPRPAHYPPFLDLDMELVRQEIIEDIGV